jgi:hypothetical protein
MYYSRAKSVQWLHKIYQLVKLKPACSISDILQCDSICFKTIIYSKEDDSEIKMIYAMLSYVKYTPRYLRISTLTGVSNTNFVMLMTSSTIVYIYSCVDMSYVI